MNIIFTNVNEYVMVHEAFRLDMLNNWAKEYGWQIFARILDNKKYPEYSNVTYSDRQNIKEDFSVFCKKHKPKKICNYIDYLTMWEVVDYDCEHIYFVRSCYAEVIKRTNQNVNKWWLYNENRWIRSADKVLVACPESQRAVKEHYDIDADIVLEYVNPKKYLEVSIPDFSKSAYYVGRFDKQKRFNLIKQRQDWNIVGIGKHELDDTQYSAMKTYGVLPFEKYKNYIEKSVFGLYPAIWESNGYGVQECLAMGKIPIIQKGSGGHERLCNNENSICIDYENDKWYEKALDEYSYNMHEAAKSTLTQEMHQKSLEKFIEIMYN